MVNSFPWKKARISQFVADHLQSQKRGRSLVVETGFPTSLIDLLHKNRDRLRKSSDKKRRDRAPSISISSPPSSLPSHSINSMEVSSVSSICDAISEISLPRSMDLNEGSVVNLGCADANGALLVIIKVSLVMILALATKTFVVGITASAIFLIFFESVGKHLSKFLKPFPKVQKSLKLLILRVSDFFINKQKRLISQENSKDSNVPNLILDSSALACNFETNFPSPEIQIVQNDCNLRSPTDGIGNFERNEVNKGVEKHCGNEDSKIKKWSCERIHCANEVSELKTRPSHSKRIKSNLKKLVPKKLRISKKKSDLDVVLRNEVKICEEQEDNDGEISSRSSSVVSIKEDLICSCHEIIVAKVEETIDREGLGVVEKEEKLVKQRNSGYLVLFLIVLSGLIGGRVLALVLTILCCSMMKSAGIVKRRFMVMSNS